MSTKTQTTKNLSLTYKLMKYLVKGSNMASLPSNVSFVPFSKTDKKLNKSNEELLENLVKEGKQVVKAEELEGRNMDWKITPVNFSI